MDALRITHLLYMAEAPQWRWSPLLVEHRDPAAKEPSVFWRQDVRGGLEDPAQAVGIRAAFRHATAVSRIPQAMDRVTNEPRP